MKHDWESYWTVIGFLLFLILFSMAIISTVLWMR